MNEGTAKAIGSIIVLVAIVALSGLVVAYYIKRRIANVATSAASVADEILTLIGVCLYLFVSSVAFTVVFLGSFDDISSDYILGLGVSGLHFFLVGGVAVFLGKRMRSNQKIDSSLSWLLVGAVFSSMTILQHGIDVFSSPVHVMAEYFRQVASDFVYPFNLLLSVLDPWSIWYQLNWEFWSRAGNHFEVAELYAPIFFAIAVFEFFRNMMRRVKHS